MSSIGMPPSGDLGEERLLRLMDDKLRQMDEKWKQRHECLQRKTDILEAMVLPYHRYKDLGGDAFFYMKLKALMPVLEKQYEDEEKLKELRDWAKRMDKKANLRIIACAGFAALTGLAVGGIVVGGTHLCAGSTLVIGGVITTILGAAALPAVGIIAVSVAGGLLIFGLGYGIAKLVRSRAAKKVDVAVQADEDECSNFTLPISQNNWGYNSLETN